MSYYLFGEFWADDCSIDMIQQAKKVLYEKNMLLFINGEISYNDNILPTIKEHRKDDTSYNSSIKFGLTTVNKPTNSYDIIFPYDIYTKEQLYPKYDLNRDSYKHFTRLNLGVLKSSLTDMKEILNIRGMRVFVTTDDDTDLIISNSTLGEMINSIWWQIVYTEHLSSIIYDIYTPVYHRVS